VSTETVPDFGSDVTEATQHDLDMEIDDDANLDVDVPTDDETEEVPAESAASEKPAKAASATRTKVPEGYVKPVEFAKILSKHLDKEVPPQVVYSYLKNNGADSKHPFPVHEVGGYPWGIKPEEGLEWWDTKNSRVATSKAARAEKAAKKDAGETKVTEAEGASAEVTEAE
jgi:hypothetical protein